MRWPWGCAVARGVEEGKMITNTEIKEMSDFIQALTECDKNIEF
jgi:sulfur relay (sulfurtransferase) complex TusBCD TusD component (DsrE family)